MHDDRHGNAFITLTYRDTDECTDRELKNGWHLPSDLSLHPSHLQKFWKRLRKQFRQKIRYYAVGEYGDENGRPHYHAIVFNCDFPDKELVASTEGIHLFNSPTLDKLWPYGFTTVGEATWETAAYCARYVMKKVGGPMADEHYRRYDPELGYEYWIHPEFSTQSNRPGIGAGWFEKYGSDVFPSDELPVPGRGVYKKVPRYYESLLARTENYDAHVKAWIIHNIKERRKDFRLDNLAEYSPARLMQKYAVQKAKLNMLPRGL